MIAKVMVHAESREMATRNLHTVLSTSEIYGSPTNIELLQTILCSDEYARGNTLTNFLQHLEYYPTAIDVISPGIYTTVQDYPGRPSAGCGIPQSGPMVSISIDIVVSYSERELGLTIVSRLKDPLAFQGKFEPLFSITIYRIFRLTPKFAGTQLRTSW